MVTRGLGSLWRKPEAGGGPESPDSPEIRLCWKMRLIGSQARYQLSHLGR